MTPPETTKTAEDLVVAVHREAARHYAGQPSPPIEPPTIHFTQLPASPPDSPICLEWETYRRAAGRLLAEGNEGRWVLIKGEEIIGLWDSRDQVEMAAYERFELGPCLIHQVQTRERVIRGPSYLYRGRGR